MSITFFYLYNSFLIILINYSIPLHSCKILLSDHCFPQLFLNFEKLTV